MVCSNRLRALAFAAVAFGFVPAPAHAQEEFMDLFSPELGKLLIRSDYRVTYVPDQPVVSLVKIAEAPTTVT